MDNLEVGKALHTDAAVSVLRLNIAIIFEFLENFALIFGVELV